MNDNKVVWDICGGLNGSVGLAINYEKYDIYTMDILPKTKDNRKNIVIDLTQEFKVLVKILSKLPKPYAIIGSPPCVAWSRAASMKGGSAGFYNKNGEIKVVLRPEHHFLMKEFNGFLNKEGFRYKFENIRTRAIMGEKMLNNLILIIKYFEPEYWYIENPATSLMWTYIKERWDFETPVYKNLTHYGAYGGISKKPTIFLSNVEMCLSKTPKGFKQKTRWEEILKKNRSDIPPKLIQEIFDNFLNNI